MKDFIVAFFGWFVLMGRNGLRVGDWVEINGVVGEVSEIGLLRTVLLETGNWNDAGHPTGRKVAFVNSFAIEGHFFNFSTTGQWLWDELQVLVPANENPYPLIDAIQKLVTDETALNARDAEEEWQRATNRQRLGRYRPLLQSTFAPLRPVCRCWCVTSHVLMNDTKCGHDFIRLSWICCTTNKPPMSPSEARA